MAYLIDIATAVPQYAVSNAELVNFYSHALNDSGQDPISRKLNFLSDKTKIKNRYSCISDFKGEQQVLFTNGNYNPSVEKRTEIFKENIMPLAITAIDKLFLANTLEPSEITHLITVSCTGIFAPGFEFLVAKHYNLNQVEKLGLNFLGCYAAIKALKHANYIAQAVPNACILIVCAELCSLHFSPSIADEDVLSNLLFADGAAAVLVTGNNNKHAKNKMVLSIDAATSANIPNTLDLMTWNITSGAFQMFLSKHIVSAIGENIYDTVHEFLEQNDSTPDYWAIHPGGIRIVEAVKQSLGLSDSAVLDSLSVLEDYGNMSSPTILFVLRRIMDKIKVQEKEQGKNIFTCAFGPGLSMEMINFSVVNTALNTKVKLRNSNYVMQH
ncbi:MAG: type III polyketide synthase [Bacteroidetes bacterium]|nr:type III polyketide synthase [Bacteroidota bacterium]